MDANPFTIIDGVPRAILVEALKRASSDTISAAQSELSKAVEKVARYVGAPNGFSNQFPKPDELDERMATLVAACAEYRAKYDIGQGAWKQAHELAEPDDTAVG